MEILKIAAIGLVACIAYTYFSKQDADYRIYLSISAGILILTLCFDYINPILKIIDTVSLNSSINSAHVNTLIKVIATAYIAQFASDTCEECGMKAVRSKIDMASRLIILYLCLPLVISLFEYLTSVI